MNNGGIRSKVEYTTVGDISLDLNSLSYKMEQLLNQIKGLLNTTNTDEVWSGDAAATARERFDELSAKFPEFSQAVADCSVYLRQVVTNYQETDRKVQGMMGS